VRGGVSLSATKTSSTSTSRSRPNSVTAATAMISRLIANAIRFQPTLSSTARVTALTAFTTCIL
jgi:hypothetical protein